MNTTWNIKDWIVSNNDSWLLLLSAFIFAELVNVVLSTIKSVVLIKGTKRSATFVNTISYTINAFVTAIIGNVVTNVWLVCFVVLITNMFGVWFGLTLLDKFRKDRLWRISATVPTENYDNLVKTLHEKDFAFITYNTSWSERKPIDVFSKSRQESVELKEIFKTYSVKYTINENNNHL